MNYREVELLAKESIATAATRTIDLGTDQVVSRLDFVWKKTNTNNTPIGHPALIVPQISVVDGSDVIFDMSGGAAQALAFFSQNRQPGSMINYAVGQWSMQIASVFFGRRMWDPDFALDPKRFNNIQLKIRHNLALGGSTGTVADLSIYAHVFDEKPVSPKGFVQSREIYSFLPVANSWHYIDMPQDFPIRALMFGAEECEEGPDYNTAEFKISENGGKNILVNSEMERYLLVQSGVLEPWSEKILFTGAAAATDRTAFQSCHWERRFVCNNEGVASAVGVTSNAGKKLVSQATVGGLITEGIAHGFAPFGQVFVPFAALDEAEGWNTVGKGNSRLDIKDYSAPDVDQYVRVFAQQYRNY